MIVYYTFYTQLFVHDIEPLYKSFIKNNLMVESENFNMMKRCPAFIDELNNYFLIKNQLDYNLSWFDGKFSSTLYDHNYFNNFTIPRDPNIGLVSYTHPHCIFFSEESVEISLTSPWMHDVDIVKNATFIPGRYNIGKHIRPLESAFIFKKPNSTVKFNEGEPQYYVKFHTDKNIQFKKFYCGKELIDILSEQRTMISLSSKKYSRPLSFFYDIFKSSYRKKFIQIIKNNLLD